MGEDELPLDPGNETQPVGPLRATGPATPMLPGYEILGELGRGGMGVVYKARQLGLNRLVALKMILHADHAGEEERQRFGREAEVLARLRHPNVVQVYEVGEYQGKPFFSLEYVDGGSLDRHLTGTPLAAAEAASLVQTLAGAVHAAHAAGIVHRDLKPANVLLAFSDASAKRPSGHRFSEASLNDCVPKVTDFGLAKRLDEAGQTQSGAVVGTPSYMAPEQAAGKGKEVGPHTDVYALGAILYESLTGRPPFRGPTALDTILQVLADEPVPPRQLNPAVPRDLETICLQCLHKEKARRYPSAAALADELGRFLRGEPVRARPVGALGRARRWCVRNPVVASLTLAVVLSLLAGSAAATFLAVRRRHEAAIARDNAATAEENLHEKEKQERITRRNLYPALLYPIVEAWDRGDVATVQRSLPQLAPRKGEEDLRGFEWHYLWRQAHGYRLSLASGSSYCSGVAFADGGKTLLTAADNQVLAHDAATGRRRSVLAEDKAAYRLLTAPDGRVRVLQMSRGRVRLLEYTGRTLRPLFENRENVLGQQVQAAVSPDGQSLALAVDPFQQLKTLAVWEYDHGQGTLSAPPVARVASPRFLSRFADIGHRLEWGAAFPAATGSRHR